MRNFGTRSLRKAVIKATSCAAYLPRTIFYGGIMSTEYFDISDIPAKLYRAENATGTVLALHGFGGSKESGAVEGLAKLVCPRGLNVLCFDFPAHGVRSEAAEQLSLEQCIDEILTMERYIAQNIGGAMYAFATSFGGLCLLKRLEQETDSFKKIVLRVPAVDMAQSLLAIAKATDSDFSLGKAREHGFVIKMGIEYHIPFSFYEQLLLCGCAKYNPRHNSNRIFVVYAEQDELVTPKATIEFLKLNPQISSLCIKGAKHRMTEENQLQQALAAAANFICD